MHIPRLLAAAFIAVLPLISDALAAGPEVVGGDWLIIESVDERGRAPFNPDVLLRQHGLSRDAAPPVEGAEVTGTRGVAKAWTKVSADEDGAVGGAIRVAYRTYESERDRVVLAALRSGAVLTVNGTPYAGDIYGLGIGPVPVALRAGTNHIYVRGVRGSFKLTLTEPTGPLVVSENDATVPDLLVGSGLQGDEGAFVVWNCTDDWMTLTATGSGGAAGFADVSAATSLRLAPLGVLKVPVPMRLATMPEGDEKHVSVPVRVSATRDGSDEPLSATGAVKVTLRTPDQAWVRTFRSAIDGSVQEYGVRDSANGDRAQIVLSVHGAGVGCRGQANAYSSRPGVVVIAPTNRREFGFDWQDWGRLDAYEALEDALGWTGADRSRVCLTGHSMGGHGTWHLAANDPDGFAAIAPSAGWSQFDNYGGRPDQARREPWFGADRASDTMSLIGNLAQLPTFVLHGTKDDNVPLSEAQRMIDALADRGAAPKSHFQEDAGHWWDGDAAKGADCVDWPPIFELFATSRVTEDPLSIDWTTVDPVVDADHHWVRVEQPLAYGKSVHVEGSWNPGTGRATLRTSNARLIRVRWPDGAGSFRSVALDGQRLLLGDTPAAQWFERGEDGWRVVDGPARSEKSPSRSGPFKRVFDRQFVLIVGTAGSDEETRELLDRARYDSETWRYRGNGLAEIVTDTDFAFGSSSRHAGRNVIVYGNADTNAAWDLVFEDDCPIRATRGEMRAGRQIWERDDLAAVFVQRRRGDAQALAAAFADSGPAGTRLQRALLPFASGVGYPDYAVFSPDVSERGDGGVLATGWFDHRWNIGRDGRN